MSNYRVKFEILLSPIANNSNNDDEKYMKIIFNSDDDFPLNKTLELHNMVVVLGTNFD